MQKKSDIEAILESQTWKNSSKKLNRLSDPSNHNRITIVESSLKSHAQDSPLLNPIFPYQTKPRKSMLAIPINPFTSRLSHVINDKEKNGIKIPTFPKSPFGVHKEMLHKSPTFEILPKETGTNYDNIKAIKIESGRIKRSVESGLSTALFRIKGKKYHKKNSYNLVN